MNQRNEQKGSSNHGNMRDPRTMQSQEKGPSTHGGSQRAQDRSQQSGRNGDPYQRDVPEPTNRSALGDQSTKR